MTVRLHDEARRKVFEEAHDLETARVSVAKLTEAACRAIYVEVEARLARDESNASVPAEPSTPSDPITQTPQTAPAEHSVDKPPENASPSTALSFAEAKRLAEEAWERDYLSRLMARAKGCVTDAARLADVDRSNFRRMLQRNGLRSRREKVAPKPMRFEPTPTHTDKIVKILDEHPHGLRTCEIADKIEQAINFAFGILKSLERQGRVERHGTRYSTLWTLPGVQPIARIETIPAAAVAVLSKTVGPMDAKCLREEMCTLLRDVGKPPSTSALKRGISRLISNGTLASHGANERGALLILAPKGDTSDLN